MSEIGFGQDPEEYDERPRGAGSRRAETPSRRGRGCLPLLVVLAVILAGVWFGGGKAIDKVKELAGSSPDFSGPGTGQVTIEVEEGDSSAAIGRTLKAAGVVKSVDAFTDAAVADQRSVGIQVGFYAMKKEMKATDALAILLDPKNLIQARVTIIEGARVKDVVKAIAENSDIKAAAVRRALDDPGSLGLPASAGGVVEGYLFPATYSVTPGMNARQLLRQMVTKTKEVTEELDIGGRAEALGYSVNELLTMASILEYEGSRAADLPKIARVFYNRLDQGMALQSDATVAYANNLSGTVWTTQEQRDNPSPYNTYANTGLPPGPIGSPGKKTIEAALNPAQGDWLFFVPINLETGETAFAETFAEHNANVEKLRAWCRQTDSPNCD